MRFKPATTRSGNSTSAFDDKFADEFEFDVLDATNITEIGAYPRVDGLS